MPEPVRRLASFPSLTLPLSLVPDLLFDCSRLPYTVRVSKKEEGFRPRSSQLRRLPLTRALDLATQKKNTRDCSKSFDKLSYLPPQKGC